MKLSTIIGFFLLAVFTFILSFTTLYESFKTYWIAFFVFFIFTVGFVYASLRVYLEEISKEKHQKLNLKTYLLEALMVTIGSLLTFLVHVYLGTGPVLASGFIGAIAGIFVKKYQVPLYCGSFVGMSSPLLLTFFPFLLATLFASIIFILVKPIFNGYGGKLGTIALIGVIMSALFFGGTLEQPENYTVFEQAMIVFISLFAATLTYIINIRFQQGPVLASAIIGIISGAFLPLLFISGNLFAVVAIGASFVGMSNKTRFNDERLILVSGILFALIFIYSAPYFLGVGGKLGTIAFLSVLSVKGLSLLNKNLINLKTAKP